MPSCETVLPVGSAPVLRRAGFADIEVEQVTRSTEENPFTRDQYKRVVDARDHDWNIFLRSVSKRAPTGAPLFRVLDDEEEIEKARIFMKLPMDPTDPYEKIAKKLKKEARQLHGVHGPRIVILDATAVGADVFDPHLAQIRDEVLNLLRRTPELCCVWLVVRRWTSAFRFKYWGVYIPNPESVYQFPFSFLQRLLLHEWRWDFLGEKEFPDLTEEEAMRHYAARAV